MSFFLHGDISLIMTSKYDYAIFFHSCFRAAKIQPGKKSWSEAGFKNVL